MKTYTYEGIEYKSESQLRKAMWLKDRIALPKLSTVEEWASYGVTVNTVEKKTSINEEERKASRIRQVRNRLLEKTDFYLMPDYPLSDEELAEIKAYRQLLRNITEQDGFPFSVTWPELPSVME